MTKDSKERYSLRNLMTDKNRIARNFDHLSRPSFQFAAIKFAPEVLYLFRRIYEYSSFWEMFGELHKFWSISKIFD